MMSDLLETKAIALAISNAANQAVALISKYKGCFADSSLCICEIHSLWRGSAKHIALDHTQDLDF